MFGSVFCTLGQVLFYNEIGVQRIKFISRRSRPPTPTVPELAEPCIPKQPLLDRIIHAIGINRLSDEEYLTQMREERAAHLRRIAKLEAQLEERIRRYILHAHRTSSASSIDCLYLCHMPVSIPFFRSNP
jgi:hypothetical protein